VPDGRPDRKCGFPVQPRAAGARCAGPAWQVIGENNRDLHNPMESMSIAMVFLDRDLRITFYTPAAVALFRFIPTDVGRPLANLAPRFEYPGLLEDARGVLEKLVPIASARCVTSGAGCSRACSRVLRPITGSPASC
jgi:hypothetical protein